MKLFRVINKCISQETADMVIKDIEGYKENYEELVLFATGDSKTKLEEEIKTMKVAIALLGGEGYEIPTK